ncbi:hypothetical protein HanPI659440_Chr13g0522961 [Helianthus annuus]|nr:hypothetical protein HanPI659440_Chr13g0522891 [Helianthus annuus]KAJ0717393.1 hypothetical protein HanPI659440_Chr13g0522961 [Helianthus annuus]
MSQSLRRLFHAGSLCISMERLSNIKSFVNFVLILSIQSIVSLINTIESHLVKMYFYRRQSKYGWKPVDAEIQKKGVMEEALTIVCWPIISRIPCIN